MADHVLRLAAPAKVNLHLAVHGRRPDGYHELSTVMQAIDLCDELTVARVPRQAEAAGAQVRLVLRGASDGVPTGDDNLAVAAARAWLAAAGRTDDVGLEITLDKRIPAGGGLGGGSSDAAAVLVALDALLGAPLGSARLAALAAELGSDVPFFVVAGGLRDAPGGTALCTGRGEIVTPLPAPPPFELTLVLPGFAVSTAAVYAALRSPRAPDAPRGEPPLAAALRDGAPQPLAAPRHNDLTAAAATVEPRLQRWLARGDVQLSGSGATLFTVGPPSPDLIEQCEAESIRFVSARSRNR